MSVDEVGAVLEKIKGRVKYVYLHLMGEPLLHSELEGILALFRAAGIPVCITTNGTLLKNRAELLIKNADIIHKVSLSLHALEGNGVVMHEDTCVTLYKGESLFIPASFGKVEILGSVTVLESRVE